MAEENCCERHVDGKVTLFIPTGGIGPFIVDSVYKHRPRGYYESIQCPSCRLEQKHSDESRPYFSLKTKGRIAKSDKVVRNKKKLIFSMPK